jgi:mRNA interferase RelE/StbE
MATYTVELTPAARRDLKSLSKDVLKRVDAKILSLAKNPRPHGVKVLHGHVGFLRIRVGDYRIVYCVEDDRLVVLIVRVGHRRDVYRQV